MPYTAQALASSGVLAGKLLFNKPLAVFWAGSLAFGAGELLTQNASWATAAAIGAAAIVTAFCRYTPAIILARKEARIADGALLDTNFAHLFEQQQKIHNEILTVRQNRIVELVRHDILQRATKHKLTGVISEYQLLIRHYEHLLTGANVVVEPYKFRDIAKVIQDEDEAMMAVSVELFNHKPGASGGTL